MINLWPRGIEGIRRIRYAKKKIRILCCKFYFFFFYSSNSWDFTRHLIVRQNFIIGRIWGEVLRHATTFSLRRGAGYRWYPAAKIVHLWDTIFSPFFFFFFFFNQIGRMKQKDSFGKIQYLQKNVNNYNRNIIILYIIIYYAIMYNQI